MLGVNRSESGIIMLYSATEQCYLIQCYQRVRMIREGSSCPSVMETEIDRQVQSSYSPSVQSR